MPGVVQQQTTTVVAGGGGGYAPFITAAFGREVQLWNYHGKFLVAGDHNPHAHHDPHHGFRHSSHWLIEAHDGYSDKVRLRSKGNGKFLCHDGHSKHCSMHHNGSQREVAWHMEQRGSHVAFRSHSGHYLGCDDYGHEVHAYAVGHVHDCQKFEMRFV
jgi:hypothetical protein